VTGVPIHTGLAEMDGQGRLTHFEEKPKIDQPCHAAVSVFSRRVLDYVQAGDDLATNTIPAMMAAGEDVRGMLDETAFWHDVGRLSDIDAARSLV
jgi:NDP-sugar pyrophosphorylase family protein